MPQFPPPAPTYPASSRDRNAGRRLRTPLRPPSAFDNLNPEELIPIPIPPVEDFGYGTGEEGAPGSSSYSPPPPSTLPPTPSADRYRSFIDEQSNLQPPGLGRRMALGALAGVAEGRGLRGPAEQAQLAMQGIDPRAREQGRMLSDLADLERQQMETERRMRHEDTMAAHYQAQTAESTANRKAREDAARMASEDRNRNTIRQSQNDLMDLYAKGAIPASEIPRAPDLPPAIPRELDPLNMLGESTPTPGPRDPSFRRVDVTVYRPGEKGEAIPSTESLAMGAKAGGGSPYMDSRIDAALKALPDALAAIDGLDIPETKKAILRRSATGTANSGNDPTRFVASEISNLNIRSRVTDPAMIGARAATAGAVGRAGAMGRIGGEQTALGGPAAASAFQEEVETGQRDIPEVPAVFKGEVAMGMQGAGTMAIPPQARVDMRKLDAVEKLIDQWEAAALKVNKYYGAQAVVFGVGQKALALAQAHPDAQELNTFKSRLGQISRGIGQEVGVATEGDINRAAAGVGQLGDSEEITRRMFASLRETLNKNRQVIVSAYTKKYPRGAGAGGAGGAGIPTPPGGGPPSGGSISVRLPDGSTATFPNQAAADAFKKAAGIP